MKPNQHVFFAGIGGIGMSGLARHLRAQGCTVAGYDRTHTALTQALTQEGISVWFDYAPGRLEGFDAVIYTPAVGVADPYLEEARRRGLPIRKRAEVLGILAAEQHCLAVAGTHGKTTVSAMLAHLLRSGGVDCTAFIGGIANNLNANYVGGEDRVWVVEADEYDRSFLQLHPDTLVLTALDPDHLDIYGTGQEMERTYHQLLRQIRPGGTLVVHARLAASLPELPGISVRTYGAGGDFEAGNIRRQGLTTVFDCQGPADTSLRGLQLGFPGDYQLDNMLAALCVAQLQGVEAAKLEAGVRDWRGVRRRFDIRYRSARYVVVDDYAHHPEELRVVLQTLRACFPGWQIVAAFQPHLFSRTRDFASAFGASLSIADEVMLTPIYPAREAPIPGVSSEIIYNFFSKKLKPVVSLNNLTDEIMKIISPSTVVAILGAGDIDNILPELVNAIGGVDKNQESVQVG